MCCIQQHPRQISSLRSLDYLVHWGWIPMKLERSHLLNYLNCFAKNSRTFRFESSVGSIFAQCWNGSGVELVATLNYCFLQGSWLFWNADATGHSTTEERLHVLQRANGPSRKAFLKKFAVFNQKAPTRIKKTVWVASKAFGRNE